MNYSIDMIRLSVKVPILKFNRFMSAIDYSRYEEYRRSNLKEFRYNFKISDTFILEDEFYSWYLAYQHNTEQLSAHRLSAYTLVIEFNPNKVSYNCKILSYVLKTFFTVPKEVKLVSCDVAIDLYNVHIDDVLFDKNRKRKYMLFSGVEGKSIYFGNRGSNGHVKIYDKGAEQKSDKVWTRYEVHLTFKDLYLHKILGHGFKIDVNLPVIMFDSGQEKIIEDAKVKACLFAIRQGYMTINDFPRVFREKIKPYLEDTVSLKIDNGNIDEFHKIIITFIENYYNTFCVHLL